MPILGIDLGTTNSLASVWLNGRSMLVPDWQGEFLLPSVVSMDEDGTVLVGKIAKERLVSHPDRTVGLFKRFMGSDKKFQLGKEEFTPEELSSFVLRQMKEHAEAYLEEPVTEAVISVPAYFSDRQRSATKRAGELAGFKVERLVNEPSAASLAYRIDHQEEDSLFLIVDFGGGTLDVSVVDCFENVVNVVAISGDNCLGGSDFDQVIARDFCVENGISYEDLPSCAKSSLLRRAEICKIGLTGKEEARLELKEESIEGTYVLSHQKLIDRSSALLSRLLIPIKKVLTDAQVTARDLNQVILAGGSCRMPIISRFLEDVLGKKPVDYFPETVVALGVGTYAGIKERRGGIRDIVLTDICPFTLGTGTFNPGNPKKSLMSPIIERNSILPCSKRIRLQTVYDNQKVIECRIYQGEAMYCENNLELGRISIHVPPKPKGQEMVVLRFTYDINGILEVELFSESTGEVRKCLILGEGTGLTEEAVKNRLKELERLKIHPREREENRLAIAMGERLFEESLGETRNEIRKAIIWFEGVVEGQELYEIEKARKKLEHYLRQVEAGLHLTAAFLFCAEDETDDEQE